MQQVPSPIACASFSEFKPLPGTPGLKAPKSSQGTPTVTGYDRGDTGSSILLMTPVAR
jgi:hypothetical protein